uniref:Cell cycle checkpoint control protein RAD9A n=1 Tax=Cynoglossus semilaevis TaxID=244447 RepID=A0A3P8VLR9_CYNSE
RLTLVVSCDIAAFGKAIHALSRIGEDLWLLALRSVNSAHSAYACFVFSPMFFQHYSLGSNQDQGSEIIHCKLAMKSVLPLFRSLTSIERNVERCQITINTTSDRVKIMFICKHGLTKTHNLHFQESESLQAEFAADLCPNILKAPARLEPQHSLIKFKPAGHPSNSAHEYQTHVHIA